MRSPDQIGITWEENQSLMMKLKEKQALENRRKNNIFEVGDSVVYIELNRTDSVLTIKSMITGDHLRHPVALMGGVHGCGVIMLRHATDAEIKAGKRLEAL